MKKLFVVFVIAFATIVGWHMMVAQNLEVRVDAMVADIAYDDWETTTSINPFNSVITIHIRVETVDLDDWTGFKAVVLNTMTKELAYAMIDQVFADVVRERRDVYAMIVPYRVRVTVGY